MFGRNHIADIKVTLRIALGLIFLVLGIIGLFLPILQGLLFIVIGLTLLAPYIPVLHKLQIYLHDRFPQLKRIHRNHKSKIKSENQRGALFDWDGVVLDSSPYHEMSWDRLAEEEGLTLPDGHFKKGFGRKNEDIIPLILKWTTKPEEIARLSQRKEELYREILKSSNITPLPGVREWLEELKDQQIPCVVASSTERANIDCLLKVLKLEPFFKDIVCGDDVTAGKPDPQVFMLAAERIGVRADKCIVFEDAPVGIAAARAANMSVVAVTTSHPAEKLKDCDYIVNRLDELNVSKLKAWCK